MENTYIDHPVHDRLRFAHRRLDDLREISNGNIAGTSERQQLVQEFFFHLCGAVDFLAQEVNVVRNLGLDQEKVKCREVCRKLAETDSIKSILTQLHPTTRNKPLPNDPYSEEGMHFRVILLRNYVSHIRNNPFGIIATAGTGASVEIRLPLDPRKEDSESSKFEAFEEMRDFLDLVKKKCDLVLRHLKIGVPAE